MKDLNILMINNRLDMDHPELGFSHGWAHKLADRVQKLFIITLNSGKHDLPDNVEVYSMGGERGSKKARKILNFYSALKSVHSEQADYPIDGVFVQQNPDYGILVKPYSMKKPLILFKGHGKASGWRFKSAHAVFTKVLTSVDEAYPLKTDKKVVVGQAIDTSIFSPLKSDHDSRHKKIISVSRISTIKHIEIIIEAIHLLGPDERKGISFDIYGEIEDHAYYTSLQNMIDTYELSGCIKIRGPVPYGGIRQVYQNADFFLHASETISIDKVVLEAMACGNIVLAPSLPYEKIMGSYADMLTFEMNNPQDMARKLKLIIALSPAEQKRIRSELREIVVAEHSIDTFFDTLVSMFQNEKERSRS